MNTNPTVRIMAIVQLLNEVEVKGHDNLVRVATAINELSNLAKEMSNNAETKTE